MPNSFQTLIQTLKARIQKLNPLQRANDKDRPSGTEVGLKHPDSGSWMLLGDNGMVDLGAKEARLTLQGANSTAYLRAAGISIEGADVHVSGRFWVHGFQQFDPLYQWYSPPASMGDPSWLWRFSPLVANSAESLELLLGIPLLVGDPANIQNTHPGFAGPGHIPGTGQHNITLGSMIRPQPLFGPNRQLEFILKHLAELAKETLEH
jgi:hypothetical protein